jgi:hypothetical protein
VSKNEELCSSQRIAWLPNDPYTKDRYTKDQSKLVVDTMRSPHSSPDQPEETPLPSTPVMPTVVAAAVLVDDTTTDTSCAASMPMGVPNPTPAEMVNAVPHVPADAVASHDNSTPGDVHIATVEAQVMVMVDVDIEAPSTTTRAEFLSATFFKPHATHKLGIHIAADDAGDIRIIRLPETGSVQHSPLRIGDKLLSINGKNCIDMDSGVAGELLRSATGTLTIITHNQGGSSHMAETMVEKPDPTSPVGIGVHQTVRGSLHISKVTATGLFAHSLINVGDRVIAVNQVNCDRMEAATVVQMIRDAPKYVTLLTATQSTAGVVLAASPDLGIYDLNIEAKLFQNHFCYCLWMIIISLFVVGLVVGSA